jgi:sugar/nucleoside kinase (ribokinase family)
LLDVLQHVDIFFPNDREAKKAAGTDELSQAINVLAGLAKIVIVKRGASAAICRSGQEQCSLMPASVNLWTMLAPEIVSPPGSSTSF